MINSSKTTSKGECKVCYLPHNDEIHEATLRIHQWLQHELTRKLSEGVEPGTGNEDVDLAIQAA